MITTSKEESDFIRSMIFTKYLEIQKQIIDLQETRDLYKIILENEHKRAKEKGWD